MPLLGQAAMLLTFDVAAEAIAEHDDWHTHEHLPERLSIPGFIRGTRWISLGEQPRYVVIYEVAQLATLTSEAYLQRLNNPSPWTSKMMTRYRNMNRGFCSVTGSFGLGVGHVAMLIRFKPQAGAEAQMRAWLVGQALPQLPAKAGIGGVHLLEGHADSTDDERATHSGPTQVSTGQFLVPGIAETPSPNSLAPILVLCDLPRMAAPVFMTRHTRSTTRCRMTKSTPDLSLNPDAWPAVLRAVRSAPVSSGR